MVKTVYKAAMIAAAVSCFSLPLPASAELTVIYDSGNTKPTGTYLKGRIRPEASRPVPNLENLPAARYPVTTEKLSPGPVEPKPVALPPGFRPLFIIGDDELSRRWLSMHRERLLNMRAAGIVAQVESEAGFERLQGEYPKLRLMALPADGIAAHLPVKHYPVLITADGVSQ